MSRWWLVVFGFHVIVFKCLWTEQLIKADNCVGRSDLACSLNIINLFAFDAYCMRFLKFSFNIVNGVTAISIFYEYNYKLTFIKNAASQKDQPFGLFNY